METLITNAVAWLLALSAKYAVISVILLITGGLYWFITTFRVALTAIVKVTKTTVDDNVLAKVLAFCDKYAYGFGALEDYFEKKAGLKK